LVSHTAKEQRIGLGDVFHRVAMDVFVRDPFTMIAAPVQCDVDGIPKRSHYVLLKRANEQSSVARPAAGRVRWSALFGGPHF